MKLITLAGNNSYQLQALLRQIIAEHKEAHGSLSIDRYTGADIDISKIKTSLMAGSLFSSSRLIIIEDIMDQKVIHEDLKNIFKEEAEHLTVVVRSTLDKRSAIYKYLKQGSDFTECTMLDASAAITWLTGMAGQKKLDLDRAAASLMVEMLGTDQWLLGNELDRLSMTIDGSMISSAQVKTAVVRSPKDTIFDMLDLVARGNTIAAVKSYKTLQSLQVDPHYVLSMIVWQMHIMAIAVHGRSKSSSELASLAKISPYVLGKVSKATISLKPSTLKQMLDACYEADQTIKTTAAKADRVVEHLLYKMGQLQTL